MIKISEETLRLVALISCFIQTIFFLVENFFNPNFVFADSIIISPNSEIKIVMEAIGVFNLLIGLNMFFYTFFKKVPIMYSVFSEKEKERPVK